MENPDHVYAKIARRILPFLILLFVVAWLDRVNVGFAKLQMSAELGFSEAVFGFGAGIFYLGYLLFEVPSNLLLAKIGARKTIARITILWGLTSIAMMFVRSAGAFYALRFLLGAFEAGLYPGVILYLTYWFPAARRTRMTSLFMISVPIAGILGGPISGWIMSRLDWKWLFFLEGLPSVLMGLLTLAVVVDTPAQATWLSLEEKALIVVEPAETTSFRHALRMPRVWLLAFTYFCLVSANPTLGFFGPTIIAGLGVKSTSTIGWLSAIPYLIAIAGIVFLRRAALSCALAAIGLIGIGVFANTPALAFASLILGVTGVLSAFAPFWQFPTTMLGGTAAAGGIALINSFGNLSGWLGPYVVGWLKDTTGTTAAGLYVVAALELLAAVMIVALRRPLKTSSS